MASKRIKGITIKIGADTQELTQKIKEFEDNIYKAKTSLKDVNNLLKMDPKNTELLTQKQKLLNEAIANTDDKLKEEKKALEQLQAGPQTDKTIEQQERLTREINDTEQQLESLKKEYKDFGSVAQQQSKIAADGMKSVGEKVQEVGSGITSVGKDMTKYVTAPIVAAGTVAVKKAADFESGMSKVQAISGATADEMERLKTSARDMAAQSKFTASETADAYSYMAMAGWKAEQMIAGLPGILNLAAAADEDLATTSDIVTDSLTAFGMSAEDSTHFADVMAAAATNSNTNVSKMGESFKYAANAAGTLGYTVEDVALGLGLMANNGIKADMAGTSLRNMFNRMAKPTKESAMAMDRLGLSLYDNEGNMYSFREIMLQMRSGFSGIKMSAEEFDAELDKMDEALANGELTQKKYDAQLEELTKQAFGAEQAEKARAAAMLGGTRAMSGLLAIVGASDKDFNDLANAIDTSSDQFALLADGSIVPLSKAMEDGAEIMATYNGRAEAMSNQMLNNLNGQITILKSNLEELAIEFGEVLLPKVSAVVEKVGELVDKFQAMSAEDKEVVVNLGMIAAAIGPVLIVIGSLVTAVGKVIWALGTIKGAFAAGGVFAGAGEALGGVGAAIGGLLGPIALVAAAIGVWIHNWDEIVEAGQLLVERTQEHLAQIREDWIAVHDAISVYASAKWEEIKNNLSTIWEGIKIGLKLVWETMTANIREKIEFIKGVVTGGFGFIVESIKSKVGQIPNIVKNALQILKAFLDGFIEGAKMWGQHLIDNLTGGIKSKIDNLKGACTAVGEAIKGYLHFSQPDVGPLSNFNSWMPDMMKQMSEQITAGIPLVESAIQNTAGVISDGIDYSDQLSSINNGIGQLAGAGVGNITIPVYIGQTKFAQAVVNANQSNTFRSGGR